MARYYEQSVMEVLDQWSWAFFCRAQADQFDEVRREKLRERRMKRRSEQKRIEREQEAEAKRALDAAW